MKSIGLFVFSLTLLSINSASQDFSKTDTKILTAPDLQSVDLLASYINTNFSTQTERSRAIYLWVAKNLFYDVTRMNSINYFSSKDEIIIDALKNRKGICTHYAFLFNLLANKTGIKSYVIFGRTKQFNDIDPLPHAWCAAKIDTSWFMFDPSWGSGGIDSKGNFIPKVSDAYFKVSPTDFIKTHFPFDIQWQFLLITRTFSDFYDSKNQNDDGPYFNFPDSLTKYDIASETGKIKASIRRMENSDEKDQVIKENIDQFKIEIENILGRKFSENFNAAANFYNEGIIQLNNLIKYRNKKFQPSKSDKELKEMVDKINYLVGSSKQKLETAKGFDNESTERTIHLSKSIEELEKYFKPQRDFLYKYLSSPVKDRATLFK